MERKMTIHIEVVSDEDRQHIHLKAEGDYTKVDAMNIMLSLGRDLDLDGEDFMCLGMAGMIGMDAIGGELKNIDSTTITMPSFGDRE